MLNFSLSKTQEMTFEGQKRPLQHRKRTLEHPPSRIIHYICTMIHNLTALLLTQTPGILCLERDFILCEHPSFIPYVQEGFRSEMLMIFYCVEGTLHACVGDEAVSLSAGDVFLCRPCPGSASSSSRHSPSSTCCRPTATSRRFWTADCHPWSTRAVSTWRSTSVPSSTP